MPSDGTRLLFEEAFLLIEEGNLFFDEAFRFFEEAFLLIEEGNLLFDEAFRLFEEAFRFFEEAFLLLKEQNGDLEEVAGPVRVGFFGVAGGFGFDFKPVGHTQFYI